MASRSKAPERKRPAKGVRKSKVTRSPAFKALKAAISPTKEGDYKLTPTDTKALTAYLDANEGRAPKFRVNESPDGSRSLGVDHPDDIMGTLLQTQAWGSTSLSFAVGVQKQLANIPLLPGDPKKSQTVESSVNFMASIIAAIKPADEIETLLALQMGATHVLAMRTAGEMGRSEMLPQYEASSRAYGKLAHLFATQLDALNRHRGKVQPSSQKIVVEHVHVYPGGQANLGIIGTEGAPGVPPLLNGQSHGQQNGEPKLVAPPNGAPVLGNVQADALPVSGSGDARKARVSIPRRHGRRSARRA